jgi:hypothetical protein
MPDKSSKRTWIVKLTRAALTLIPILVFVGCSTERRVQSYIYSPPVVVTFHSLRRTNDSSIAAFEMTNVSREPMWFDGEAEDRPACCIEYKSMPVAEHSAGGGLWGDAGLGRYQLGPGESREFHVVRSKFTGSFRAGVWLSSEADNKTQNDLIYWSDFVSP